MKRTVLILGTAAALLAAPSVASAGTPNAHPQKAGRVPAFEVSLQSIQDDRSGQTLYRLGNSGLWMQ